MPSIAQETVEAVRATADLVELVRGRVDLVRRGGRWWGRCPFHEERTPSFGLIPPDNRAYYCHGCGAKGDAITWMQEIEGAGGFAEAITDLAERFNIDVRYEGGGPRDDAAQASRERRQELLDRAAEFYVKCLWEVPEAQAARDYLSGRGFSEELLRRFRVGYAPPGPAALAARALDGGFTPQLLEAAGLARERGGRPVDFFQARITFPIADARGRVQGFGARTLDPNERAKYVNSPEGPQFRKRRLLFGLAEARASAARGGAIVVAEGYTDVLGLVAAGIAAAVACMGTSLTEEQLVLLRRATREVRLCFDADEAGQRAAWRSLATAASAGVLDPARGEPLAMSAVHLPSGSDPGDMVQAEEGPERLRSAVEGAEPLLTSLITARTGRAGPDPRDRDRALDEIVELLRGFPDSIEKDEAVRLTVSQWNLSAAMSESLFERTRAGTVGRPARTAAPAVRQPVDPGERVEIRLLALARADPSRAAGILAEVGESFTDTARAAAARWLAARPASGDWPAELEDLGARLAAEIASHPASPGELEEMAGSVRLAALKRRAHELRAAGDERAYLEVLGEASRVREALRGRQ